MTERSRPARQPPGGKPRAGPIAATVPGVAVIVALAVSGLNRASGGARRDGGAQISYNASTKSLSCSLPAFAGGLIDTAQFAGQPVTLNFYGSRCEVRDAEMPHSEAAYHQFKGRAVDVHNSGLSEPALQRDSRPWKVVHRDGLLTAPARCGVRRRLDPCIGPTLASILTLSAAGRHTSPARGALLAFA